MVVEDSLLSGSFPRCYLTNPFAGSGVAFKSGVKALMIGWMTIIWQQRYVAIWPFFGLPYTVRDPFPFQGWDMVRDVTYSA